jgi:cellulose synthase/poly-beta-1,6-N-acetylglucosamine synthase-like glycosyltransferase
MNSTAAFDSDFVKSHSSPQRTIPGMLSIVIPCHNEEPVIETTHRRWKPRFDTRETSSGCSE